MRGTSVERFSNEREGGCKPANSRKPCSWPKTETGPGTTAARTNAAGAGAGARVAAPLPLPSSTMVTQALGAEATSWSGRQQVVAAAGAGAGAGQHAAQSAQRHSPALRPKPCGPSSSMLPRGLPSSTGTSKDSTSTSMEEDEGVWRWRRCSSCAKQGVRARERHPQGGGRGGGGEEGKGGVASSPSKLLARPGHAPVLQARGLVEDG